MRSEGQVRFITITTRMQVIAAAIAAGVALVWLTSLAVMAVTSYISTRDRASLLAREAKVTSAESRVSAYGNNLKGVADDLARRQQFLEKMVGTLPQDVKQGETVSNSKGEAAKTVDKVSLSIPEAAPLARIEERQLAFVEGLTRLADRRSAAATEALRKLGLNPDRVLAQIDDRTAMGGPFIPMGTEADGSLDPRFQRLGVSLARMEALQRSLAGVPSVLPANFQYISSGFGYRIDPFTRGGSFHPGLDFKGPIGAPVYAAAKGRVIWAGPKAGYGNCVEVDHGNGLVTRYGHMSRIRARVGQEVTGGEQIGAIGSTGRSTGPHLHFEVRINDQPVNPRPILEAAPHVLEEARSRAASLRR